MRAPVSISISSHSTFQLSIIMFRMHALLHVYMVRAMLAADNIHIRVDSVSASKSLTQSFHAKAKYHRPYAITPKWSKRVRYGSNGDAYAINWASPLAGRTTEYSVYRELLNRTLDFDSTLFGIFVFFLQLSQFHVTFLFCFVALRIYFRLKFISFLVGAFKRTSNSFCFFSLHRCISGQSGCIWWYLYIVKTNVSSKNSEKKKKRKDSQQQ